MGREIERKFLVGKSSEWQNVKSSRLRQGYLLGTREKSVRVRTYDNKGYLTVKGATVGAARTEFEYEIPFEDAEELLDELCDKPLIEKTRRLVEYDGRIWEVDEFCGENKGLIVAEIELEHEDQAISKPPWVTKEVTGDPRYYNANLAKKPFNAWDAEGVAEDS